MIEAILFDAEGVVVDSEAIWDKGQILFLEKRGIKYDREMVKPLLTGQSMIDGVKVMKALPGYENLIGNDEELAQERMDIVQELFKIQIEFIPGFKEFHNQIKNKYKNCIATAMNRQLLKDVNGKLNLESLFGGNVFSIEDVGGKSKPDPAIFLYSAKKLGINPKNCLVIEDAPHGISAAKNARMYCVGINTTYPMDKLKKADQLVSSFDQIKIPKN
jgi:HAD superfamily hydrolase (TIGR01549 family)